MKRRDVIASLGVGIAGLAGCSGSTATDGSPTRTTTESDPCSTEPQSGGGPSPLQNESDHCAGAERFTAFEQDPVVEDHSLFTLQLCRRSLSLGDILTVRLENATDTAQNSGNRSKYDIQTREDGNWDSVFSQPEADGQIPAFHSDAVLHDPGEGFTWNLELSQGGLSRRIENGVGVLAVCSPLQTGEYRFVYPAITDGPGVATTFTVTE